MSCKQKLFFSYLFYLFIPPLLLGHYSSRNKAYIEKNPLEAGINLENVMFYPLND